MVVKPHLAHCDIIFFGLVFEIQRRPSFLRQGPRRDRQKNRKSMSSENAGQKLAEERQVGARKTACHRT